MRWLLLMLLLVLPAHAEQGIAPDDVRLELVLEERDHIPLQGEMILLSIRGTYKIPVVREKMRQPVLDGFDWMQLGEDRWYKEREDGFEVLKLERRMALFPQRAGTLEIPSFTHGLEMLGRNGRTVPLDKASNSLKLTVAPRPDGTDWWFPVRAIQIEDNWSNQPEALSEGGAALRVVALTVDGSAPQRIPPMPEMTGAGAFIFPHPEHRIVALGPDGPRTRVFWRWTVRPMQGSAGYTNPIRLSWFDTEAQEQREISLSAQRVAYAGGPQQIVANPEEGNAPLADTSAKRGAGAFSLPGGALLLAVSLGLTIGLGLTIRQGAGGTWRWPRWLRAAPAEHRLRRAARSGDAMSTRNAAYAALRGMEAPPPLRQLDAFLFGTDEKAPNLSDVAREVIAGRRRGNAPEEA